MNETRRVQIVSTSPGTADVTPICLRGGGDQRTRLMFYPMLVENTAQAEASVRGTFAYQRKKPGGDWEDEQAIRLSELTGGQGVRLELHAAELLHLHKALAALYEQYDQSGIRSGGRRYILVDARSPARDVLDAISSTSDTEGVLAVIDWVGSQDASVIAQHFQTRADTMAKLDNTLGIARLERFVEEAEGLLNQSREGDWQALLQRESWALGQLYAEPVVIVAGQAYVGGKNIRNRDGNVADFLYRNSLSDNCLLVEIKRSDTPLIVDDGTARNGILNVSREVTGAAQQLLQNRYALTQDYLTLVGSQPEFFVFNPRLLLVVGSIRSLVDEKMRKSFELYRGEQRNLEIVAFDELVAKAKTLLSLLRSA